MGLHNVGRAFHHLAAPTESEDGSEIIGEDAGAVGMVVSLPVWILKNTAESRKSAVPEPRWQ